MGAYLVGIDGSEHSIAALNWARGVAADDDSIIVTHAWEFPVFTGYESPQMIDTGPIESAAREYLETTLNEANDSRLSGRLVRGPAARAVVQLGEQMAESGEHDGDITLVVGHRGNGKVAMLLGSTAAYVVHHTQLPVVIVRGEPRLPLRRVVVGVDEHCSTDLSGPSMTALRWAFTLTGVDQIDVHHAVFVPGVVAGPLSQAPIESDQIHHDAEKLLHDAISAAGGAPSGIPVNTEVSHGSPNFALIEASRDADLLVVGSRGRGGFRELLVGSTSLAVTAYAHCPVAVVRSG